MYKVTTQIRQGSEIRAYVTSHVPADRITDCLKAHRETPGELVSQEIHPV